MFRLKTYYFQTFVLLLIQFKSDPMKTILLILGVCIFSGIKSFGQDFKKLNDSEIDKSKITIARDFAQNYMTTTINKGETYQFKDEALEQLKNGLTPEKQKAIAEQFKSQMGNFKSLTYAETWIQGESKSFLILRFKSEFEKNNVVVEIRVVLNDANKIAGFFFKPWSESLN